MIALNYIGSQTRFEDLQYPWRPPAPEERKARGNGVRLTHLVAPSAAQRPAPPTKTREKQTMDREFKHLQRRRQSKHAICTAIGLVATLIVGWYAGYDMFERGVLRQYS